MITSCFEAIVKMANPTMHIVVGVDDDIRIRQSIESLLESAGFVSLLFPSAEEFLKSGKLAEISCLITDVRMSGIDGLELQRRVRFDRPQLPVIFISGHRDDAVRRKAMEDGAFAFMYKPFDPEDLLDAVNGAVSDGSHGEANSE
jgi:FixJ family two-component response regulator